MSVTVRKKQARKAPASRSFSPSYSQPRPSAVVIWGPTIAVVVSVLLLGLAAWLLFLARPWAS